MFLSAVQAGNILMVILAFQHACLTLATDSEPETLLSELLAGTSIHHFIRPKDNTNLNYNNVIV
jgi:hypothetical protein